jgi:3-carboxy-cis,cis-muconate cycloisomerase
MTPEIDGDQIFSATAHTERILRFEAALARAAAGAGMIEPDDAAAIERACRVDTIDVDAVRRDAMRSGTIVVPILAQLRSRLPDTASTALHRGATSQDAIDTAVVLQMREGLDALAGDLRAIARVAAALAERHRRSVMPGRTLMQHAVPITFGLKAARWLGAVARQIETLRSLRQDALVLQFGGAAGTLAAFGERGTDVAQRLAAELDLPLPDLPWHAERDRPASIVAALGVTAGILAKIAGDIVLLSETDVAEVAEGAAAGKGVSSAMPQKRNPVDAINAIASARLAIGAVPVVLGAMVQEHERGAGGWQVEWTAIPDAFRHTLRAAACVRRAMSGLDVKIDRMRDNLADGWGVIMAESLTTALTHAVGLTEARNLVQDLVARCTAHGVPFAAAAKADERVARALDADAIDRALDPGSYLGSTQAFIDRALASWRRVNGGRE